jgi:ribosomal protein S18 acetylase RimI-like enzyme
MATTGKPADVWLGVWSENFGAQRIYNRFGFEHVSHYEFKVGSSTDHEVRV